MEMHTAPRFGVFTSVDEGLNRDAIRRLESGGVPVIPMSVKTLHELTPIAAELELQHAMIFEAGGAIARWSGMSWDVEACGVPAEKLLDIVLEIEDRSGANLLVQSALPENLDTEKQRCYSEPFVIESGDLESVKRAAAAMGYSVRSDRHFLHLCRSCDQAQAFTRVREELQCDVTIAIGSTAVDAEFLQRADIAIILPGPDGKPDPELVASVPNAQIASDWTTAVEEILERRRLAG